MSAPLETERQAATLPAVRATYDAMHASPRHGVMAERNHRMLCDAITAAGVELGAFDHRIVQWLSQWEPQTCAVIAGIIGRAASPDAGKLAAIRSVLARFDWEFDDRQLALEEIDRIAGGTS